jgi:hypothetical protein
MENIRDSIIKRATDKDEIDVDAEIAKRVAELEKGK